ncbi:uncharacterized protein L969DRAFT_85380 [Mixia osmundae IAM 14324]|uniref:Ribosomal protein L19 n=1 Tax=Mixia osmundae (strain CBS 9802 / IAM 14324 / JCM 22182 / KY 12970) TaxID=764103 RepID=G7DYM0_MIXOS|nr:uncharacterized protein L969DRAFT_85380 [Mixia osmundae IAM 14324]KEI41579.1 hypothetical protein L969DRAFT_85380 [Mixia osmundae IAM 14324]GAA95680.1 hypothetical protein E5Q_02337 [Mixia osmundae IAM 14324]
MAMPCSACRRLASSAEHARRGLSRGLATAAISPDQTSQSRDYDFSSSVKTVQERTPDLPKHLGLLDHVNANLPRPSFASLFERQRNPLRRETEPDRQPLHIGSILAVETFTSSARTSAITFAGVLIGVRRRGVDTTFTLRNLVAKTGTEMKFSINSPLIRSVQVISRARKSKLGDKKRADATQAAKPSVEGEKSAEKLKPLPAVSQIRRARRAKMTYLRHQPKKLPNIASYIKLAARASTLEAERTEATARAASDALTASTKAASGADTKMGSKKKVKVVKMVKGQKPKK